MLTALLRLPFFSKKRMYAKNISDICSWNRLTGYGASLLSFCLCLLITGCSFTSGQLSAPSYSNPTYNRNHPDPLLPQAMDQNCVASTVEESSARIDLSNIEEGYIGVSAIAPTLTVLRIRKDGNEFVYSVPNNGEDAFYPLVMGNGTYDFEVFYHLEGIHYINILSTNCSVTVQNERQVFTMPIGLVDYAKKPEVVGLAHELAEHASNDLEVAQQVYYWVKNNIEYDETKAQQLKESGMGSSFAYVDDVLSVGKGVCMDYAVLTAALFRANGIPCKLVMGMADIGNGTIEYHAWNMVWIETEGNIFGGIKAKTGEWTRIDLTFAASGASEEALADDTKYMVTSQH